MITAWKVIFLLAGGGRYQARIERQLMETRRQIDVLLGRIVKAVDDKIVGAYEQQIAKYQTEGEILQERLKALGVSAVSFETALEVVISFLKNPLVIWEKEDINAKRLVMRLVFAEKLAFHPELGFETAQKSLLIGLFQQISANKTQDVEMGDWGQLTSVFSFASLRKYCVAPPRARPSFARLRTWLRLSIPPRE